MFHVYGLQGRSFAGTLEELRRLPAVSAAARARGLTPVTSRTEALATPGAGAGPGAQARAAYGAPSSGRTREPLTRVADVMSRPAFAVTATATVGQAWQELMRRGIGQAPVVTADGTLVGLVGRAELLPIEQLAGAADLPNWQALLAAAVTTVMWSPVPSTVPETDLRRAAALLLTTGLPGAPVTDDAGQLLGFVSRSDLLRAMVTDPPLDLWG